MTISFFLWLPYLPAGLSPVWSFRRGMIDRFWVGKVYELQARSVWDGPTSRNPHGEGLTGNTLRREASLQSRCPPKPAVSVDAPYYAGRRTTHEIYSPTTGFCIPAFQNAIKNDCHLYNFYLLNSTFLFICLFTFYEVLSPSGHRRVYRQPPSLPCPGKLTWLSLSGHSRETVNAPTPTPKGGRSHKPNLPPDAWHLTFFLFFTQN